jgi:dienelactone hydrolase
MNIKVLFLFTCLIVATGISSYSQSDTSLFRYNPALVSYHEDSVFYINGIQIRDIVILYPGIARQCKAYLMAPVRKGPHPGIVYFHWLGRPNGNRNEFLQEALTMTAQGATCILVQGFFPWKEPPVEGKQDKQKVIDQTLQVRMATDIILKEPGVDSSRIAFVGHDYGAMYGTIAAGLDRKFKACVFITGMGNFGDWAVKYWKGPGESGEMNYRKIMEPVDPIGFMPKIRANALLFQFATQDIYITKEVAMDFFNAAPEPKEIKWYETEHAMNTTQVKKDRMQWLAGQLHIQ